MDWSIDYMEGDNYVKVTSSGIFSAPEHPACFKKLFSCPFWKPGMNLLFDNRKLDFGQINLDKMRTTSFHFQSVSAQLGKGKVALLMNSLCNYGLGRQFQLLTEDELQCELKVSTDEQETLDWLESKSKSVFA